MCRQRHARAAIAGNHRGLGGGPHDHLHIAQLLHLDRSAGELEGVGGRELRGKAFLHPPERSAVAKPHLQHLGIHDDPGIQAMARGMLRMGEPPLAVAIPQDPLEAVIGLERVAAGGDEVEHARKHILVHPCIGQRIANLPEQLVLVERCGAGASHYVLGEHVEPPGAEILAIALPFVDRIFRRLRFEEFESIARNQQRTARLVEPVVGPSHTLEQTR